MARERRSNGWYTEYRCGGCGKPFWSRQLPKDKRCRCAQRKVAKEHLIRLKRTHGMSQTRFWKLWNGMRQRCSLKCHSAYKKYGAKGIKVCKRWQTFENFRDDMHRTYLHHVAKHGERNTTLDRVDAMKNYCKENCRWATYKEQNRHRSNTASIQWDGKERYVADLAEEYKIDYGRLFARIKSGWPVEKALFTPKLR